jgi:transcriptional regulator with XRE-family HTH domain
MITLKDIRDHGIKRLQIEQKSERYIKNCIAAFNTYTGLSAKMKVLKKLPWEVRELDLASNFKGFNSWEKSIDEVANKIWSPKTAKTKRSMLKVFYTSYLELVEVEKIESLPSRFSERLSYFITKNKYKNEQIIAATGISRTTLWKWLNGISIPTVRMNDKIVKLDHLLDCKGELLKFIQKRYFGMESKLLNQRKRTKDGQLAAFRAKYKFGFHYQDWPERLKAEWEDLRYYKTADSRPRGMDREDYERWQSKKSEKDFKAECGRFFGFLIMCEDGENPWERGIGINSDEISLAHLTDPEYQKRYKDYLKERSQFGLVEVGGKSIVKKIVEPHNIIAINQFLKKCKQLVKNQPSKGYFLFNYKFENIIETYELETGAEITWENWCRQSFDEICRLLTGDFKSSYDRKECIKEFSYGEKKKKILTYYLPKLRKDIESLLPNDPEKQKLTNTDLIWCRRLVLCAIQSSNPLRINQVANLKIGKHLIKKDGVWHWDLSKEMFKNRKYKATNIYMPCAKFLNRILNIYVKYYRPNMEGASECSYLMRGCANRGIPKKSKEITTNTQPMCDQSLWRDARIATSLVDDDKCSGWSAHLFRTLTATGLNALLGGKEGIEFASHVLCDSIEVTDKNYNLSVRDDSLNEYTRMVNAFDDGEIYLPNESKIIKNYKDRDISQFKRIIEKERKDAFERETELKKQINALIKKLDHANEQNLIVKEFREMKADLLKRLER